jgi:hypothetical protein
LVRLAADNHGLYYLRRRELNRVCEAKQKALEQQREMLLRLGGPLEKSERKGTLAQMRALMALQAEAEERRKVEGALKEAREAADNLGSKVSQLRTERERLVSQIAALDDRIQTAALNQQGWEQDAQDAEAVLAKMPDRAAEIGRLQREITTAERDNEALRKRELADEQVRRLAGEAEAARAEHKKADDILKGLRELRGHLLDGVDLGVKGLSVGDDELRLNGLPFAQASTGQAYEVAIGLAAAARPGLGILLVDNAESLDNEHRDHLFRIANQHGLQLVLLEVDRAKHGLCIEITEDGAPAAEPARAG